MGTWASRVKEMWVCNKHNTNNRSKNNNGNNAASSNNNTNGNNRVLKLPELHTHCRELISDVLEWEHEKYVQYKIQVESNDVQLLRVQVHGAWVKVSDPKGPCGYMGYTWALK